MNTRRPKLFWVIALGWLVAMCAWLAGCTAHYDVRLIEGDGFRLHTVQGQLTGNQAGDSYSFRVELEHGWSGADMVVTANGVQLTADDSGVFVVESISADTYIMVNGVTRDTVTMYSVTSELPSECQMLAIDSAVDSIVSWGTFHFAIVVDAGWDSLNYTVTINGALAQHISFDYVVDTEGNRLTQTHQRIFKVFDVLADIHIVVGEITPLDFNSVSFVIYPTGSATVDLIDSANPSPAGVPIYFRINLAPDFEDVIVIGATLTDTPNVWAVDLQPGTTAKYTVYIQPYTIPPTDPLPPD